MRWLLLLATLLSWLLCFTRQGAGAMAIWLFVGIVCAIATVMAFVQARIDAGARPETMLELTNTGPDRDKSSPS